MLIAGAIHYWYAGKIQKTTDGGGRCALGQARTAFGVVAPRGIEADVQIDERERAPTSGQDQAQNVADQKTETQVIAACELLNLRAVKEIVLARKRRAVDFHLRDNQEKRDCPEQGPS
jgi:hypothetical protein